MVEKIEQPKTFVNPITGKPVDESITEKEGVERGYLDFQFMLRHLEDENEFVKYFVIEGKRIIVNMSKPHLQYKNKSNLDYERLFKDVEPIESVSKPSSSCTLDEGCESCSG